MTPTVRRWQQRCRQADSGFTLIELIVAMVITLVVMSVLLGVFVSSLSTVSASKQRQAATALSNQRMEQLRATPYDTVTQSNGAAAPTTDPNVSGGRFKPVALPGIDEELVVNAVSPQTSTLPLEGVDYTVRTYVSKVSGSSGQPAFNLTVLTSWSTNVSNGPKTNVERSVTFSPSGCLSTATHPFSGPCQASFSASATELAASISVVGLESGAADIPGFNGNRLGLELPTMSTDLLLEQISTVGSAAATMGASASRGSTVTNSGGVRAAASGDTDPDSPAGQSESVQIGPQTSERQHLTGSAGELRVTPSTEDTGKAGVAVNAEPTQCTDGNAAGSPLTGGLPGSRRPCATAEVQAHGAPGLLNYLPHGGAPSMLLASIGPAPSPMRAVSAHLTSGENSSACTNTSGAGCVHAAATRAMGDVLVGGLPAGGGLPAAFSGSSWQVKLLTESVVAEEGVAAREPSYDRTGGLTYWNGLVYEAVALTRDTSGTINTAPVTWTGMASGQTMTINVTSTIILTKAQAPPRSGWPCEAKACLASGSGKGGIRGNTTYTVTLNGALLTKFLVVTDLGGLIAQTAYTAAPSA